MKPDWKSRATALVDKLYYRTPQQTLAEAVARALEEAYREGLARGRESQQPPLRTPRRAHHGFCYGGDRRPSLPGNLYCEDHTRGHAAVKMAGFLRMCCRALASDDQEPETGA